MPARTEPIDHPVTLHSAARLSVSLSFECAKLASRNSCASPRRPLESLNGCCPRFSVCKTTPEHGARGAADNGVRQGHCFPSRRYQTSSGPVPRRARKSRELRETRAKPRPLLSIRRRCPVEIVSQHVLNACFRKLEASGLAPADRTLGGRARRANKRSRVAGHSLSN